MEKTRECSRVHAQDDKIMWLGTGAKETFSLAVCSFMYNPTALLTQGYDSGTSNVVTYFCVIDSNRLLCQYHMQDLHNADPRTSFRLPSVVKKTEW
jgi:hypothetical protein